MAQYRDADFAQWASEHFDWDIEPAFVYLNVQDVPENPEDLGFEAQRPLDRERAAQMARHYLPAVAAGVIVAVLPDKRTVFVDGQHRWQAARVVGQEGIWTIVYHMGVEQASAFFRLRNGPAVSQSSHMDSTLAAYYSQFPPVMGLSEVLDKYGCYLDRKRRHVAGAVGTSKIVATIYAVDQGVLLDKTLDVITACWGTGPIALRAEVLEGMALFLAHWGLGLDTQRQREMRQRFRDEDLDALVNDALRQWTTRATGSKATHIEAQLVSSYNVKRTLHRLPDPMLRQLARMDNLTRLATKHRQAQHAAAADTAAAATPPEPPAA